MGNKRKRKNYHWKIPVKKRGFEKIVVNSRGSPERPGYTRLMPLLVQEEPEKHINILQWLLLSLKMAAGMAFVIMISLVFIFLYDFSTQCDYFRAERIVIKGIHRISEEEIIRQAQIRPGINILSVNLSKTRKRLEVHPWIAQAGVRRELPSEIHIKIAEHEAIAILSLSRFQVGALERYGKNEPGEQDLGHKFMIDAHGKIFKKWNPYKDPNDLPLVSGLDFSDINISGGERFKTIPYNAVMSVLRLGRQNRSIIPNSLIKKIRVDREMGITLQLTQGPEPVSSDLSADRIRAIKLGYNNYPEKYDKLKSMLFYLKRQQHIVNIDFIDLNNLNRIVVSECGMQNAKCGMQDSDI